MRILESSYSTAILLYVAEKGQCKKTDIYDHTAHGATMPRKIDELENAGLLVQEKGDKMTLVRPTEKGARVAQLLAEIRDLIVSGGEAGEGRRGHAKSEIGVSVHDLGQPKAFASSKVPWFTPSYLESLSYSCRSSSSVLTLMRISARLPPFGSRNNTSSQLSFRRSKPSTLR